MKSEKGDGFYCADFTRDGELFAAGNYFETLVFDRRTGARTGSAAAPGGSRSRRTTATSC